VKGKVLPAAISGLPGVYKKQLAENLKLGSQSKAKACDEWGEHACSVVDCE